MKTKEELYQRYSSILNIVYLVGGVILVKNFYLLSGLKHKTQTWRILSSLEESKLIERCYLDRKLFFKLKAYVLKKILKKENAQSIEVTRQRVLKSVYISQVVYEKYIQNRPGMTADKLLDKLKRCTTLCYQSDSDVLINSLKNVFVGMDMDTSGLKLLKDSVAKEYSDNSIRKLINRNIFIYGLRNGREDNNVNSVIVSVAILDIDHSLSMKSIVRIINDSYCKCQHENVRKVENKNVHLPTKISYPFPSQICTVYPADGRMDP